MSVVSSNNSLASLSGLDKLTTINGELNIFSNTSLTLLNGLNSLNFIGGGLSISSNNAWISLNSLNNLDSIVENNASNFATQYYFNSRLNDFCSLRNFSLDTVSIANNNYNS